MQHPQQCAHTLALSLTHTYTHIHVVFCRGFSFHFLKKSTLTLKLGCGLPTLLLLYVFPLEAITAQTTAPATTFSYGCITFGQRVCLFMSSMHCTRWKTIYMILWSIMVYILMILPLPLFHIYTAFYIRLYMYHIYKI